MNHYLAPCMALLSMIAASPATLDAPARIGGPETRAPVAPDTLTSPPVLANTRLFGANKVNEFR
ncbi:MAG: hypothetical protein ABI875_08590, partial [Gemmatimonadales bacterium]